MKKKQPFNIFPAFLLVGTLSLLLFPALTLAGRGSATEKPIESKGFCIIIDRIASKVSGGITVRESQYAMKRIARQNVIDRRAAARIATRNEYRHEWDTVRDQQYVKLERYARNARERAAIRKFRSDIDEATLRRRNAVDAAILAFHDGVKTAIKERQQSVDAVVAEFKLKMQNAIMLAKGDCRQGVFPETIREDYAMRMIGARDDLRASVGDIEQRKNILHSLASDQQAAIAATVDEFTGTVARSRETLRAAFLEK